MSDTLTILTCEPGRRAVKVIRAGDGSAAERGAVQIEDYDAGSLFVADEREVSDVRDLGEVLSELEGRADAFVIRGAPVRKGGPVNRRVKVRDGRADPDMREQDRCWVALDLDSVPCRGAFADDPEGALREIRDAGRLGDEFRDVTCYWQATASAGFKPGVRARVWFWLSRGVGQRGLEAWARTRAGAGLVKIDASLFRTVQPHYVGRPVLVGVPDPMGTRSGWIDGSRHEADPPAGVESVGARELAGARAALRDAAQRVGGAAEGERRNSLNREAYGLARRWGAIGALGRAEVDRDLGKAAGMAGLALEEVLGTIEAAWADGVAQGRAEVTAGAEDWTRLLSRTAKGEIRGTAANVLAVLEHHPDCRGTFRLDVRRSVRVVVRDGPWTGGRDAPRDFSDEEALEVAAWISRTCGFDPPGWRTVAEAAAVVAARSAWDPFEEWLDGCEWDGRGRLDRWLVDFAGAADDPYTRAVGRRWLIGAVARVKRPGCKMDEVLVLEGPQGLGKSRLLRALVPEDRYFRDHLGDVSGKSAREQVQGPVVLEWSELNGMSQREIESVKAFLSSGVDSFRPSYGREVKTYPRRLVIAGSTNEAGRGYLRDATGGRRFWCVALGECRPQALEREREALWAEARLAYEAGERWHLTPEEQALAEMEQEDRFVADPWEHTIREYLAKRSETNMRDLYPVVGHQSLEKVDTRVDQRLGAVLKRLGWARNGQRRGPEARVRVWRRVSQGDPVTETDPVPNPVPPKKINSFN